ncbi:methionine import ATP-binding protein MetN 2 [mine drainage metagenome]|uniref:Methionine import ATP-binding protein MetN 2 n=1 Tax=mine drainage metagenome TaxID=410659 RepID=A0A1J5PT18_9ZZZZ
MDATTNNPPVLEVRGLTKRFGGLTAVKSLNLDLRAGEIFGLIGPNGSGKSTAMKSIMGIERPTAGEVIFQGENVAGLPAHKIARKGFGMVFQHSRPLNRQTVLENIMVALLPDSLALDWAGPAEALRIANQVLLAQGQPLRFVLRFIGPLSQTTSSVGLTLSGLEPLPQALAAPTWLVLVGQPGQAIDTNLEATQTLLHWLRGLRLQSHRLELMTVCAGAVLAAHAGLLAGRHVTTHHHHLAELQAAEPACHVVENRVFVEDAPVYSSAGVTTGIDLMLYRIAQICGEAIAAQVAQTMVVALRRGPQDPQLSPFLAYRNHLHPALHRVQDAVSSQPAQNWHLVSMAAVACTSPRHLTRLFMLHAHIAPLQYLRRIRLAVAQTALQSGRNVTQAAALAGFGSDTQLRRAWHQSGQSGTPSKSV